MSIVPFNIQQELQRARDAGQKVILVTGVFDLLHSEHQKFLRNAKELGGFLLVGVESDARVRKLKGPGRPVRTETQRVVDIEQLDVADAVFILPENFSQPEHHEQLMREVRPNFLAISSHSPHQTEKKLLVEKYGGELRIVSQHNPAVSTTKILEALQ